MLASQALQIVDAILYVDRTGCPWRYLPASFPPWQTVYGYFAAWRDDRTLPRLHSERRAQVRAAAGRDAQPTAAVIDFQSARAADTVPKATRGWDAAKKVNGRKRHIAVDTTGLLLDVVITAASVQDRDAALGAAASASHAVRDLTGILPSEDDIAPVLDEHSPPASDPLSLGMVARAPSSSGGISHDCSASTPTSPGGGTFGPTDGRRVTAQSSERHCGVRCRVRSFAFVSRRVAGP